MRDLGPSLGWPLVWSQFDDMALGQLLASASSVEVLSSECPVPLPVLAAWLACDSIPIPLRCPAAVLPPSSCIFPAPLPCHPQYHTLVPITWSMGEAVGREFQTRV